MNYDRRSVPRDPIVSDVDYEKDAARRAAAHLQSISEHHEPLTFLQRELLRMDVPLAFELLEVMGA